MSIVTKIKIWSVVILIFIATLAYGLLQLEFVQKKVFDVKADLVGSERTVSFYSKIDATKVASYSDKDTRYEVNNGVISVWLGSQNKKIHSNMDFIIEDIKK